MRERDRDGKRDKGRGGREGWGPGCGVRDGRRERDVESDREQVSEKTRGGSGARAREEGTDGDAAGGEKLTDSAEHEAGRGGTRQRGLRENEGAGSGRTLGGTGRSRDQPPGVGGRGEHG